MLAIKGADKSSSQLGVSSYFARWSAAVLAAAACLGHGVEEVAGVGEDAGLLCDRAEPSRV